MSFELGFIASMVRAGDPEVLAQSKVTSNMISKSAAKLFEYIKYHYVQHGKLPSFEAIKSLSEGDISELGNEPVAFYEEKIIYNFVYEKCKTRFTKVFEDFDLTEADPGRRLLDKLSVTLHQIQEGLPETNLFQDAFDFNYFYDIYRLKKEGNSGVKTPYETWNKGIGGFEKENLITIAARTSVGKTWFLLSFLEFVWSSGKRVLFISTEMSRESIVRRLYSIYLKTPYGRIAKANLSELEEIEMFSKAKDIINSGRFKIFDAAMDSDLDGIELQIMTYKPDFVGIDGAYLLKSSRVNAKDRYQRIAEMMDELKKLAKRCKVPVMITSQMNRESNSNTGKGVKKKAGLERLAFSDNLAMVSDYVFFMFQEEREKNEHVMIIEPKKLREIEDNCAWNPLVLNWDFRKMDFTENFTYEYKNE